MDRMLAAVAAALEGRPAIVLLSGGRDSTCLLDLAARARGAGAVEAGAVEVGAVEAGAVEALHVNYRLRPEADAEEAHCAGLAARLEVPLTVEHPRRPERAGNLQAWARDARYAAAARRAETTGALVAAGHTATDQVETILYRLASSPGRRALLGMRPREGRLVRPLLGFTREDTAAYCARRGLAYVDDPSNASDEFARARLRHGLVPALQAIHPAAEANVLRTAEILRDEAAVLDHLVTGLLRADGRSAELALLRAASPALARLAVQRLADD
ncbi:MAG: tRNA(Ile)-lysidine synthetase, partial [Solirubrobacterales bacterium]|nr:tRNA(Ile)-lysidine synthetase [Solirubrobacterales bacterium]